MKIEFFRCKKCVSCRILCQYLNILVCCIFFIFLHFRFPSGPKWLPIIGNTSLLRSETRKYGRQIDVFRAWKEEYKSSVIGLKLGGELVVVALDYPIIHKIHTNSEFDGRPDNFFLRLRTMGSRFIVYFSSFKRISFSIK